MTEREIQHEIRLKLGRHPTARLFRNQVGACQYIDRSGTKRHLTYGLTPGSSDLIGWRTLVIQPEHVGHSLAQFVAVELKTNTGRLTEEQRMFIELVRSRGGLSGVARSVDDAVLLLESAL